MVKALLTGLLLLCMTAAAWSADKRPIDRLGSRPDLSSSKASPAARARADAARQDLRGKVRRLEFEAGKRGELSPIRRAQRAFPPSPAPSAQELGEARRKLNQLK